MQFLSNFRQDQRGSSILEYAFVAPVFFLLFMGIIEFGLFMFHKVAIESITMQAAREATIGKTAGNGDCSGTTDRVTYIQCVVRTKAASLVHGDQTQIFIQPLTKTASIAPDICIDDPKNPSSAPATCTYFQDVNGIDGYQGAAAIADMGTAGQMVEVRVSYPWQMSTPLIGKFFGSTDSRTGQSNGIVMITTSTVVKNEPFN